MAADTIAQFCAYLQRRNYSPHTIDSYGRDPHSNGFSGKMSSH
jgi:hypothetical protein